MRNMPSFHQLVGGNGSVGFGTFNFRRLILQNVAVIGIYGMVIVMIQGCGSRNLAKGCEFLESNYVLNNIGLFAQLDLIAPALDSKLDAVKTTINASVTNA